MTSNDFVLSFPSDMGNSNNIKTFLILINVYGKSKYTTEMIKLKRESSSSQVGRLFLDSWVKFDPTDQGNDITQTVNLFFSSSLFTYLSDFKQTFPFRRIQGNRLFKWFFYCLISNNAWIHFRRFHLISFLGFIWNDNKLEKFKLLKFLYSCREIMIPE